MARSGSCVRSGREPLRSDRIVSQRQPIGDEDGRIDHAIGEQLRHAFVYDFPDDSDSSLRQRLGEAAGEAIADLAEASDVIGIAWSRGLSGLRAA